MFRRVLLILAVVAVLLAFVRVGGGPIRGADGGRAVNVATEPGAPAPAVPVDLVFLHHSVGAQLLAEPGPDDGKGGAHPNGGGLRKLLEASGYRVHEATYGSDLGEHTDLFDWLPKFQDRIDDILLVSHQDERLPEGQKNRIVLFKSCFPNNWYEGPGTEPGNPHGPALTEANVRATLRALLPIFEKHPDVLFVYLTPPPLAPVAEDERLYKWLAKKVLGKPVQADKLRRAGESARRVNDWVLSREGWLAGYPLHNVAVFPFFDVLTEGAASGLSKYASGDGSDSHPASAGNRKAAALLVPFLNAAVQKAGLTSATASR